MDQVLLSERLSWRDPGGFVVKAQDRIFRAVALDKAQQTQDLIRAPWMMRLIGDGCLPGVSELDNPPLVLERMEDWLWLEHDVLPHAGYPHEITALQLYDSGLLTLRIAIEAAQNGWLLKDASAWNVLHVRGRPVFVDFLSFEHLAPAGGWIAYGQFVRHFLLPLLLHRKLGITPPEIFLAHRDGVTPERAHQLLGALQRMSPIAIEFVVLPKRLARAGERMIATQSERKPSAFGAEIAKEVLLRTLRRLQRILRRLCPDHSKSKSTWKDYEKDRSHYSDADLVVKTAFVRKNLQDCETVLDLGCNAGEFSLLAAECGKNVVAADADHPALSRLYARIRERPMPINPFLLNIGRPTPAIGWQNKEVASFLDRSRGQFDCILVLGLVHHLLVSERATLDMLADLLERLGPKRVILEWVDPTDPKFRQLAGLNHHLYSNLRSVQLEQGLGRKFRLIEKLSLPCSTRVMYLWSA